MIQENVVRLACHSEVLAALDYAFTKRTEAALLHKSKDESAGVVGGDQAVAVKNGWLPLESCSQPGVILISFNHVPAELFIP
jgi:hypothetical protein